jgi:hypothetical protein
MKGSIFVVALLAASLTSASAFAHHSKGPPAPTSSNVSIITQWGGNHNTATVVQAQSITVVIGGYGY